MRPRNRVWHCAQQQRIQ